MATNTYVALNKITVSGSSTTSVTFTGISGAYTDLRIAIASQNQNNTYQPYIQFNADTGTSTTNYSTTSIRGNGSSAASGRHTDNIGWYPAPGPGVGTTGNFQPWLVDIMGYSNTTTYKSGLSRFNNSASIVTANVHLWRSTAAITSITITAESGSGYIVAGSTFSLYGIAAEAGSSSPKATGGAVTSDASYWYHTFVNSGNFVPNQSVTADVLVVAGGGGGGAEHSGGGGGAGGLLYYSSQSLTATNYSCIVGGGGFAGTASGVTNGSSSKFGSLTAATGGGAGGSEGYSAASGGSGGGGSGDPSYPSGASGTAGQGSSGGNGSGSGLYGNGGGGGGFSAAGQAATGTSDGNAGYGGAGGNGTSTYSTWGAATSTGQNVSGTYYYAGGGGGGYWGSGNQSGAGGNGGGGKGAYGVATPVAAVAGTANTGGGGGGSRGNNAYAPSRRGGNGGSGVIIVRYAK